MNHDKLKRNLETDIYNVCEYHIQGLSILFVFFEIYLIYKLFFKYNLCTLSYMKLHCISFVYSVHLNNVPIFHQFIVTKY